MEKPYLVWEVMAEYTKPMSCFASNSEYTLCGNSQGQVQVIGFNEFLLYPEAVTSIYHIRSNIFGIVQNWMSIVEITPLHKVSNTIKLKVQGYCSGYYWTNRSVYSLDLREIYTIEDKDVEITQVNLFNNGIIVSTMVRSVIIYKDKTLQIGKKERNGWYGACELSGTIFVSRPLGNLWEANSEGIVMITTNYKIKSEKVNFGILYSFHKFIISINKNQSGYILLDPLKKLIISSEENENNKVYFNPNNSTIYKYSSGILSFSKIISCFDQFNNLMEISPSAAITFVLDNQELQRLVILQDLCRKVFTNDFCVEPQLFEKFCEIIQKLEEDMKFPRIEIKNEIIKKDELFDEFLKVTSQEYNNLKTRIRVKIDKRIKQYYAKNFAWPIILNWLLFVILKFNYKLDRIRKFLKIARESLDKDKFYALLEEEKTIILSIEKII